MMNKLNHNRISNKSLPISSTDISYKGLPVSDIGINISYKGLPVSDTDIQTLAETIYGEARGELDYIEGGLAALIAVGNVVVNRAKCAKSVEQICKAPFQFSCWNANDPNRIEIERAAKQQLPAFQTCMRVAKGVLLMGWPDLTNGATHYYAQSLYAPPFWAKSMQLQVKIGHHLFFKEKE
ncbi:MAG: cell wall hydrolase [Holosporales bacterium]|jgi:spore germination cell wall hydrolase CwlJ-like protein|nr:cell wall hydrolase [Holosporales bacterium]